MGKERAKILTVVFLGSRLGMVNAMPLTFIWRNSTNDGNGNFKNVFHIIRIKIGHLKLKALKVSIQMNSGP